MLCSKLSQSSMGPDIKGKMSTGNFPSHLTNSRHFVPRAKRNNKINIQYSLLNPLQAYVLNPISAINLLKDGTKRNDKFTDMP